MIIGVPKEVKDHEARVGLLPSGVKTLVESGHKVLAQTGAGLGSSLTDEDYREAGAELVPTAEALWSGSDLVVKVKEPQPSEYPFLRPRLTLFTYLHLAPLPDLTDALVKAKVNAVAGNRFRRYPYAACLRTPINVMVANGIDAAGIADKMRR